MKLEPTQKIITVAEAAYIMGTTGDRLRNLIKRGDYRDIGDCVRSVEGEMYKCSIKPAAFLEKYALTWEDIFQVRQILMGRQKAG